MQRTKLGKTGLDVPVFALGTAPLARQTREEGLAILARGVELGATWWDTAEQYGTYPLVAQAMTGLSRQDLFLSTKSHAATRDEGLASLAGIRNELRTDYIDIMFLHYVQSVDDFTHRQPFLHLLREAKLSGQVRAIGLSSHNAKMIALAAEHPEIDVVLAPWNYRGDLPEGQSTRFAMEHAIRACYEAEQGVILMKLLNAGQLHAWFEDALRAGREFPYKHAVDIGVQSLAELETDIRLILGQPYDPSIASRLRRADGWDRAA